MKKINVFIVEDDPMVLKINQRFAEQTPDFQVIGTAKTAGEALESITALCPDLVLIDVYLPDFSGIELLKQIRQRDLKLDVIIITAAQDTASITEALRHGVTDYLIKPFDFDRFNKSFMSYRKRWLSLNQKNVISQEDFDNLLVSQQHEESGVNTITPKGINKQTLNILLECLKKEKQSLSTKEVAIKIRVSQATALKYLNYLERCGQVTVKVFYGSVGRPTYKYFFKPGQT
ncbi:MAG: response regulator [Desulfitobacteriaceae bacterium]|nr:response regulator [Desulfitobacteriaceae bacterium]MDI6913541.1 response regulator [Desulfitobacteriaceae bacterium]